MIAQRSGGRYGAAVGEVLVQFIVPSNGIVLAQSVGNPSVEILEPHTHRAVTVLEAGRHEAVFHLGHFGADGNHQAVGRAGGEYRVPGAADSLVYRAGPEDVGSAAGGNDDRLGLEDVNLVFAHPKADRPGDAVGVVGVGQQVGDGHPLVDIFRSYRLAGRFGGYRFDGLAVNRDLPTANPFVLAVFLFPNGQAPFLQQVNRGIYVAGHVIDQVFPGQPHHVVDHVLDKVLRSVPAVALAHVTVDGGEAFAGGAAAFNDGLLGNNHFQVLAPKLGFKGGAAAGHSAAND